MKEYIIDWSSQHAGVHQAPFHELIKLMPDLKALISETFPDNVNEFTWDVKVHMLMPNQYPCIPNWHVDNVPRINGIQKFDLVKSDKPMYLWVSNAPLTQFEHGFVIPKCWHRFTQLDKHRGNASSDFIWRGFIRATHKDIQPPKTSNWLRRHSQVYLDSTTYQW